MTGGYRRVFVILCWLMFSVDQCPGTTSLLSTSPSSRSWAMTRRSSSTLISGLSCAFWWLWQVSSWIPPSDLKVSNSFWSRTIPICRLEAFEIQPVEWANVAISLNSGHGWTSWWMAKCSWAAFIQCRGYWKITIDTGVPPYSGNLKIVIVIAMSLYQIVCPCLAGHQGSLLQGSYPWGGLRTFQQWFGSSHSISWLDWMPVICHVTTSSIN